jgi:hypothetical protein
VYTQKLTAADDGEAGDNYGFSVAMHGDVAVVGAVWADQKRGSAYVYRGTSGTWEEEEKLTAQGGQPDDQFGWSVTIHEDTIAVGAFTNDANGLLDSGAVFVFGNDDQGPLWDHQATILANNGAENDHFGRSVSLFEDWLVVSAPLDDEGGMSAGAVYIYQRVGDAWLLQATRLPTNEPPDFNELGFAVSVSKDFIVASSKFTNASSFGNVYAYETLLSGY